MLQTIKNGSYRKINNNSSNILQFEKTIEILKQNNINVILLYVPTIDKLEYIQQAKFDETISIFEGYTDDQVEFVNLQETWSHNYSLFYDPIHLNPKGQEQITEELITYLKLNI
ncbi:hypothetical protein [Owenweeksia hongkongensis]|uniref:hypothetical protein n=1 Tax=Owenweeksia hongkongensis TaxID=253245 RepID=UPI003A8EF8B3